MYCHSSLTVKAKSSNAKLHSTLAGVDAHVPTLERKSERRLKKIFTSYAVGKRGESIEGSREQRE